jgi:hypothetical protein
MPTQGDTRLHRLTLENFTEKDRTDPTQEWGDLLGATWLLPMWVTSPHFFAAFLGHIATERVDELWMVDAQPRYSDQFWAD